MELLFAEVNSNLSHTGCRDRLESGKKALTKGVELVTNPGRIGVAVVMLAVAVMASACGGGSNNNVIILPTSTATSAVTSTPAVTPTPTSAVSITPTPAKTTTTTPVVTITITPTPGKTTTTTPTPSGPTSTPTPVGAVALWVENANGNSVTEFKGSILTTPGIPAPPAPAVTNSSADFLDPAGITFDTSNNQWVSVCGSTSNHGSLTEFDFAVVQKLATNPAPSANVVISDDSSGNLVNCPWTMTFNSTNLWVANSNENGFTAQGFVTQYLPTQLTASGDPKPNITLTDPTQFVSPTGVVFDSAGDLFVSDFGPTQTPFPGKTGPGAVWVFKAATIAGLKIGTNSIKADTKLSDPTTGSPVNGAFDPSGNLWVADCELNTASSGEIYEFKKAVLTTNATSASAVFKSTSITTANGTEDTIDCPGGIAFDAQGDLWYTNFSSVKVGGAVGEFTAAQLSAATGTSSPTPNIFLDGNTTSPLNFDGPIGLTFGPVI